MKMLSLLYIIFTALNSVLYLNSNTTYSSFFLPDEIEETDTNQETEPEKGFERKMPAKKTAKPQSFYPVSTPISWENIFPPAVLDTRRAHDIGEGLGYDWTSDQKLVSEPKISQKTSRQRGSETGKTRFFNVWDKQCVIWIRAIKRQENSRKLGLLLTTEAYQQLWTKRIMQLKEPSK